MRSLSEAVRTFFAIVELRTKIVGFATFLCGSLFAIVMTGSFSPSRFLVMALAVLCVDMGTTAFNTYFDFHNGTDRKESNREADKVLVHAGIEPFVALLIACSLFVLAGISGLYLAWKTSWMLIPVGFVCMVVGFCYTGGPFPISRTPFGELFAGGFLGSALFGISAYVQALVFDPFILVDSLPFLPMVGMILSVNNGCDRVVDSQVGRKTLSVLVGPRWAPRLPFLVYGLGMVLVLVLGLSGRYPFLLVVCTLLSNFVCVPFLLALHRHGFSAETKSSSMQAVTRIYGLFCLFFLIGVGSLVL